MKARPPSIVLSKLLSTLLKALPMNEDTVGNSNAEHKILDPDIGVSSFRSMNEEEISVALQHKKSKLRQQKK